MVYETSKGSDLPAQTDQSLCYLLEYFVIIKLLTELHFEFLSLIEGYIGSSESTLTVLSKCHIVGNHMLWLKRYHSFGTAELRTRG